MQLICSIALIFVNGAYLFVAFNMESMISDDSGEKIETAIIASNTSTDFDPADLLDLDIMDFDPEELAHGNEKNESRSRGSHLIHDRV